MATIKITDKVISSINEAVQLKYKKQFADINQKLATACTRITWRLFWSEPQLIHVDAIRAEMKVFDSFKMQVTVDGFKQELEVPLADPGPVPISINLTSSWDRYTIKITDPRFADFLTEALPIIRERKALLDECEKFGQSVRETVRKFSTVNQAIKSWPALESLLPTEIVQKLRERPAKRDKLELTAVDQQNLNTTLLKLNVMS